MGQIGKRRITHARGEDDVVARGTDGSARGDGCVENVEHFLWWLLVTLLREADIDDDKQGKKCKRCQTERVMGFHDGLLRKRSVGQVVVAAKIWIRSATY